jgi:hypothetical protein
MQSILGVSNAFFQALKEQVIVLQSDWIKYQKHRKAVNQLVSQSTKISVPQTRAVRR